MDNENNNCLTKADLAAEIYGSMPLDKQKAIQIIEDCIEIIKKGLESDGKVMISGFGSYEVKSKKERKGRNPQTGETMLLAPRKVVKFKPSQLLRKSINEGSSSNSEEE